MLLGEQESLGPSLGSQTSVTYLLGYCLSSLCCRQVSTGCPGRLSNGSGQQCGAHPSSRATTRTGHSLPTKEMTPPFTSSSSHCVKEKNNGRLSYPGRGQYIWTYSGGKRGYYKKYGSKCHKGFYCHGGWWLAFLGGSYHLTVREGIMGPEPCQGCSWERQFPVVLIDYVSFVNVVTH